MLKYIFMLFFLIPLFNVSMGWYVTQFFFFIMIWVYMLEEGGDLYKSISFGLGVDYLSWSLILLSFWICCMMIMASDSIKTSSFFSEKFILVILFLMIFLYLTFSSMNMFMFYFYFEGSLIPTFLLIMGWGYQPERIQAGFYMFFYTLLASMPLLMTIFYFYKNLKTLKFYMLMSGEGNLYFLYLGLLMAFLVKLPMFGVHLWLPKAHVEAPVSGSMILAGVLLKLGGYGLFRSLGMVVSIGVKLNFYFIYLSLVGGVLISLVCLRQEDMSSLIAYSSVSHMGLMLGGMMTYVYWGYGGGVVLMIGHGLCSSGLFFLSNIIYERLSTRSMVFSSGMLHFLPTMSMWWFLFCVGNMGAPPSLNLLGEISLINSVVGYSNLSMFMLGLMSFLSSVYSLYLYFGTQHGVGLGGIYGFLMNNVREYLILFLHWVPLNMFILICGLLYIFY